MKKCEDGEGFVIRLMNNYSKEKSVNVTLCGKNHELTFAPYQVKTLLYTGDSLEESERLII